MQLNGKNVSMKIRNRSTIGIPKLTNVRGHFHLQQQKVKIITMKNLYRKLLFWLNTHLKQNTFFYQFTIFISKQTITAKQRPYITKETEKAKSHCWICLILILIWRRRRRFGWRGKCWSHWWTFKWSFRKERKYKEESNTCWSISNIWSGLSSRHCTTCWIRWSNSRNIQLTYSTRSIKIRIVLNHFHVVRFSFRHD